MFFKKSGSHNSVRKNTTDEERSAWQTAVGMGVGEALNKAGDKVYDAFVQGVKNAEDYLNQRSFDLDTIDQPKFIESMVKKSLAESLPAESPWVKAQEDSDEALQPKINRTYQSAPLLSYIKTRDLDDYSKGEYTTTKYLDPAPDLKTFEIQKTLNQFGAKDNFGNLLKEDGLFGPKTMQAADNLVKVYNNIKGQYEQTSNNQLKKTNDYIAELKQKQIPPLDKNILEHFVRGSSNEDLKNKSEYSFNVPNKYTAKEELNKILDNQYPAFASPEYTDSQEQLILPSIADNRMSKAFEAIEINSNTIKAVSEKYNIPKEIIGSIILKEQYTQSIPDWLAMSTSQIGQKLPDDFISDIFGEHSTGYGAIFPSTARDAWVSYLGQEEADKILPKDNFSLQQMLAYNNEFNITTIAVVLVYKAKKCNIINTKEDLTNLSPEAWRKILSEYNGGSEKYGNYVMEYLPYMKTILDNTSSSW